ncbi:winged helix-turn-helix transcriptional regulator [Chelatococcus reniformis]|uniref:HxlR family transcriptional regulator n=1 Tax=Chelatococcus reniformis TaxID=1494448 RepID=A0A916UJF5_9HYPH|nr:helix-turn-helix domain-containing protein [Chelatococcus reniformis]GGC75165.1 HxlR family transcriptional regulator [Chelatococcus reniformis]
MDERGGYGQFCPVSMAAEILCSRWTPLIIREMLSGTTRFNDLRRGVPRMSPALLSKRLKDLERAGIVQATRGDGSTPEYRLTDAGNDLRPIVMGIGLWGQRWVESELSLRNLDPSLLMWDMRRNLNPEPLPAKRCTIQFLYPELPPSRQNWWLIVDAGSVDLCSFDPGFDVDLLVTCPLRSMTAVWMGLSVVRTEIDAGRLALDGDPKIARAMQQWLGLSPFAAEPRRVS